MLRHLSSAVVVCISLASCGGDSTPSPAPDPGSSSGTGAPSGNPSPSAGSRLGWTQQAGTLAELAAFRYAIYVDGVRSELTGSSCGTTAGEGGYECVAPLPRLPAGSHAIELAAFIVDGSTTYESGRSAPLQFVVAGLAAIAVTTAEQIQLNLELVADGLSAPSDLAFGPDGSVFVAERGGKVRVIRDGVLLPDAALDLSSEILLPEGGVLALALDPKFKETQTAYLLYAVGSSARSLEFTVARFRSLNHSFGERAVLLDRIPASPLGAGGSLRVGADGKLYVALDDAANGRAPGNLGSFNGKILRLNLDATTPDDQAGATPVYSLDHPMPRAFDWQPRTGELWVVDGLQAASGRLSAVMADNARAKRASVRKRYDLPEGTGAASASFYRGNLVPVFRDNLFIAAEAGRHLIRLGFDPQNPERIVTAERLLQDQLGGLRVVATGPEGALYICNETQLWRLAP